MIRTIAAGLAALLALTVIPAVPVTAAENETVPVAAAENDLWPHPQGCATVTLDGMRGLYRPDSDRWEPWFDATVRGSSAPCRSGAEAATLAVTQYHVRDGVTVGLMSAPWQAEGVTPFHRFGRIAPDVAALCVSTGLTREGDTVKARHAVCVRPYRSGAERLVTAFVPVPRHSALVTAPLSEYPVEPTLSSPECEVDCLVSPWVSWPPYPGTTRDGGFAGRTAPLKAHVSDCHTVTVRDSFLGPSDDNTNAYAFWLSATTSPCKPTGADPSLRLIRYWPDRGVAMEDWDLTDNPDLIKHEQISAKAVALCVSSGMRRSAGKFYAVHDMCWRIAKTAPDVYRLAPIPTDDARVGKPLASHAPAPNPDYPPGVCASCL